jgi:transposase InsO family protein
MRSLHDKSFFRAWDVLYSASNPSRDKDRWIVDGVLWLKERHAYWGTDYSVQLEVHQLQTQHHHKGNWKILVVVERWWGDDKQECIKDQFWCKLIEGAPT